MFPTTIAYSPETTFVSDLMKYGSESKYHDFLDVDWNHPSPKLKGKIFSPFLKGDFEESLRNGEIKLGYHNGFQIQFSCMEFPVGISSYMNILRRNTRAAELASQDENLILTKIAHSDLGEELKINYQRILRPIQQRYQPSKGAPFRANLRSRRLEKST